MKKIIKQEKKLSLKKLQIMKISDMKTINGGNLGGNHLMDFTFEGGDEPPTIKPPMTSSGK
ncbi:hypothetical protein PYS58_19170 [Chryseobacterium indologenes]|uniref:hypothetical protein n=1 Tax=Chryseobacterium TaxID=59732 RepID=UPI001624A3F7|nr:MULTISPECIES: hypothetical protein [Chryseobacterium]MDM1557388.1 hypothetical protein [Chryseobacterium indologenes]WET48677.1 hypothetical protein PYS58_19170 [Chryseobacterium indologenes]